MEVCPLRPCGFCMLSISASASSSSDRNFWPFLCLGLLVWTFRGAAVERAFPPLLPPARRWLLSLEKNCWACDWAGLVMLDADDAREDEAAAVLEASVVGWLDITASRGGVSGCCGRRRRPALHTT